MSCYGDGNCLYRYMDKYTECIQIRLIHLVLFVGLDQSCAVENNLCTLSFRVRIVCELTLKSTTCSLQLSHFVQVKNVFLATSANFHQAAEAASMCDSLKLCFQLDCCDAAKSDTLTCGMCMVFRQSLNDRYNPYIQKLI